MRASAADWPLFVDADTGEPSRRNRYAEIDLEMKAKALQTCAVNESADVPECTPKWHADSELMSFLSSL